MPWWNPFSQKPAAKLKPKLQHLPQRSEPAAKAEPNLPPRNEAVSNVETSTAKTVEQSLDATIQSLIKVFHKSRSSGVSNESRAADVAGKELAKIGVPAIAPLIAELGHMNDKVGSHAIDALREIGAPAVEPLLMALNHTDTKVRYNAIRALGFIGDSRAVESLIRVLDDDSKYYLWTLRETAIWALGRTHNQRACEPLIEALNKPERFRIRDVIEALGEVADPRAVEPLIAQLSRRNVCDPYYPGEAAEALGKIGDGRAVEPLIAALSNNAGRDVVEALGKLRDSRAVEALISALNKNKTDGSIAEALGKIGDTRAVKPLLEAAKVGNSTAVKALAAIGDSSALEQLLISAVESDWKLPTDAILELGLKNRPLLDSFLTNTLQSCKSIRVRRHAAEILVRIGEPAVKTLLPAIIFDWLEFTSGKQVAKDDGLRLMADYAGMDAELIILATTALGYSTNTKLTGSKHTVETLVSFDGGIIAVQKLCERSDKFSSCVLYRVSKKKDTILKLSSCDFIIENKLSFEKEREAARQELVRRRLGDSDPITLLQQ